MKSYCRWHVGIFSTDSNGIRIWIGEAFPFKIGWHGWGLRSVLRIHWQGLIWIQQFCILSSNSAGYSGQVPVLNYLWFVHILFIYLLKVIWVNALWRSLCKFPKAVHICALKFEVISTYYTQEYWLNYKIVYGYCEEQYGNELPYRCILI